MSESGSLLRVGRGHVPRGPSVRPDRVRAGARAPTARPEAARIWLVPSMAQVTVQR